MIAITGHTSGIGKFINDNYNCIGFSRSNGYDISKDNDRMRMYEESKECDTFINCAYYDNYQSILLEELSLYNPNIDIINIGSDVTNYDLPEGHRLERYKENKLNLIYKCQLFGAKYRSFGYVATERILRDRPNVQTISVKEAVRIIFD